MIKHYQKFRHDPANGVHGDCMRTVIACLLNKQSVDDVPHFLHDGCDGVEFNRRIDEYLAGEGLALVGLALTGASVSEIIDMVSAANPDTWFLITGRSPRGVNHVVIARNGMIVHDPCLDGGGLVGPTEAGVVWVEFLVPRAVHKEV